MASHKSLKSVARSFVDSFTSLMNYSDDDYVLGHVVRAAWKTGGTQIRVDLLTGAVDSSPLLVPKVAQAIESYVRRFPELIVASNSSMDFVSKAEFVLEVDPNKRRGIRHGEPYEESPYSCSIEITDDQGKSYTSSASGWWYPEEAVVRKKKRWWCFWRIT